LQVPTKRNASVELSSSSQVVFHSFRGEFG